MPTIVRISTNSSGAQGNYGSYYPTISADGRYVAFASDASTLVAGDTNGRTDVFLKDVVTGQTVRLSTDSSGAQGNYGSYYPTISADGRYVAFASDASTLVAGDTNGRRDVFLKDVVTGQTVRLSTDSSGAQGNSYSTRPTISADGRYVAYGSFDTNLVAGDTNGSWDVFVKDVVTGQTVRGSSDSSGEQGDYDSLGPTISADGRYVAFVSVASNLVAGDTNRLADVFVKDVVTGQTVRVSTDSSGAQGNSVSGSDYWPKPWRSPTISADGRYVAFVSVASNLVPGDPHVGWADVFVKDVVTGQTVRLSTDSSGVQGNGGSYDPTFSADGRYVAFSSFASNLVAGDTNGSDDIFMVENPLSASDDIGSSASLHSYIAPNFQGSGKIEQIGDRDWFSGWFEQGKTYAFGLSGAANLGGTLGPAQLKVLDSTGTVTLQQGSSQVFYQHTGASAHLWLEVTSAASTGTYSLLESEVEDTYDTKPTALGLGTLGARVAKVTDYVGTSFGDASDWYSFTLKEASAVNLTVSEKQGDLKLTLRDASGNAIVSSTATGRTNEVIDRSLAAGTYYAQVIDQTTGGTGSVYELAVTRGGGTMATATSNFGSAQWSELAHLSKAAYYVAPWESREAVGESIRPAPNRYNNDKKNVLGPTMASAGDWGPLSEEDLGLEGKVNVSVDPLAAHFRGGLFTHRNAAVLVGRSADALVISFRGTNDNDNLSDYLDRVFGSGVRTPDEVDWTNKDDHYRLFTDLSLNADGSDLSGGLIQALDDYVAAQEITKVYVTGHSLGGAMAINYLLEHPAGAGSVTYEGVTYAAPGFGFTAPFDPRVIHLEIDGHPNSPTFDGDPVPDLGPHPGASVHILFNGLTGFSNTDFHTMDLYRQSAIALDSEGITAEIRPLLMSNQDVTVVFTAAQNASTLDFSLGAGNNVVNGSIGADWVVGGAGNDTLKGGLGNDTLVGSDAGNDKLDGGDTLLFKGTDIAFYGAARSGVNIDLNLSVAQNTVGAGTDTLISIEGIIGSSFNDTLSGNTKANSLDGRDGNDTMSGGSGNDTISGDAGNDYLIGGTGKDNFVFDAAPSGETNVDTIMDFLTGSDKIVLAARIFTAFVSAGVVLQTNFRSTNTAQAGEEVDFLIYQPNAGKLFYDPTGNGGGGTGGINDRVQIAVLSQVNGVFPILRAADFVVSSVV